MKLALVASAPRDPAPGASLRDGAPLPPMSRANLLGQARARGVGPWDAPGVWRSDFPDRWRDLIRASFTGRDAVALFFDVTFQTACNWWDGTICRPAGDKVAMMALADPARFAAVMGGAMQPRMKRVA